MILDSFIFGCPKGFEPFFPWESTGFVRAPFLMTWHDKVTISSFSIGKPLFVT